RLTPRLISTGTIHDSAASRTTRPRGNGKTVGLANPGATAANQPVGAVIRGSRVPSRPLSTRSAMAQIRYAILAFGVVAMTAPAARADDARAVVDKAIKAHGGADAISKFLGHTVQVKGTFHGMGQEIPFTGTITSQGRDRLKVELEVEAGGQKFRVVNVVT